MLRVLLALTIIPIATLLGWLALSRPPERADFVLTSSEPRTIDPARVSWLHEIQIANALFEGLTRTNPDTYEPEPAVAAHWEIDAAQTEYTFFLRADARWSNGAPVIAEHFRYAWLRALDPRVGAQYASLLFVIRGTEEYFRSRLNDDPADDLPGQSVGIDARAPRTLHVVLTAPCPYFLELTSFPTFAPLHPPTLERWGGPATGARAHLWTRPGNIVGNGAFVLTTWNFKQRLLLQRNPWYWDPRAAGVKMIEVYITSDPNAALVAYETGRVDLVRGLPPSTARALLAHQRAGRRSDFHVGDRFATFFLRVNCRRPPLDNADLRKALSLAVDRAALCEYIMGLGETPAYTYIPRGALHLMPRPDGNGGTVFYEPPEGLGARLDPDERRALAREYLRRSGSDQIAAQRPIELAYAPEPEQARLAEAIQAMWEATLGIRVTLRAQEAKVLSTRIRNLDYDVVRSDWFGDYLDPSTFLNMFRTDDGQNRTGWSHAEYDRLIAAANAEPDNARRFALFRDAERILCADELPIITLFHRRGNFLLNPRFTGLTQHVRDVLPIHRVRRADGRR